MHKGIHKVKLDGIHPQLSRDKTFDSFVFSFGSFVVKKASK